ncbi:dihydrolipoyl dehydrogenase [Elongatibacter sediminis]|uniref:Dihydrolipoyl dehydrogenase n=1 Tax=Elongatibacter sediminis TaxID=3119006 RepID=A0AAW9RDE2_9GAMM
MQTRDVDVAVIGAGSAGLVAYRSARKWTKNVVLIEGGPYGTTCARVGCMPSKLLIAAAEAAHAAREASEFGVNVDSVTVDGRAVMNRVRRERDRFVGFVVEGTENIPEENRLRGYARFLDDHRLQVDDHTIVTARRIVIATGSSPSYPKAWDALGNRLLVNDDIFGWDDLPRSVAVFGPGVIGLELGQALHRLGVDVKMFGLGGLVGPLTDPAVVESARAVFSKEFYLDADVDVRNMERVEGGVRIEYVDHDGHLQTSVVDYVVAATGRRPNVAGLGLENTRLPLDDRGIPVFDDQTLQVGRSHVFIAGDVNNDRPLLHEAADEGRIAGGNAGRFFRVEPGKRTAPLAVVFSDPQIAMVGHTYRALEGQDIVVGEVSFENQGRSRVMLKNQGLLRVYADAETGCFLGAEMIGPRAEHLAHLLAWSYQSGHSIQRMLEMPFYHPVIEEGLRTALRDANAKLQDRLRRAA